MIDELTGVVGSSQGQAGISKTIILFQKLQSRPGWNPFKLGEADKSHTYIHKNRQLIIETHALQGVKQKPAAIYHGKLVTTYKPLFLTPILRYNMQVLAEFLLGDQYGYSKIPLLALDSLCRTYWFSKKFGLTSFKVCSQVIGWLYQKTPMVQVESAILYKIYKGEYNHPSELNYKFGVQWKCLTPDTCEDWMKSHEEWDPITYSSFSS